MVIYRIVTVILNSVVGGAVASPLLMSTTEPHWVLDLCMSRLEMHWHWFIAVISCYESKRRMVCKAIWSYLIVPIMKSISTA